jgi:hypothetical protein
MDGRGHLLLYGHWPDSPWNQFCDQARTLAIKLAGIYEDDMSPWVLSIIFILSCQCKEEASSLKPTYNSWFWPNFSQQKGASNCTKAKVLDKYGTSFLGGIKWESTPWRSRLWGSWFLLVPASFGHHGVAEKGEEETFARGPLWYFNLVEEGTTRGTTALVCLQLHISLYTGTVYMYCQGLLEYIRLVWPPTRDVGRCPQSGIYPTRSPALLVAHCATPVWEWPGFNPCNICDYQNIRNLSNH